MSNDIQDKDKKDWQDFISSKEKLPNKDQKYQKKSSFKIRSIDLHGYSLDHANKTIDDFIQKSYLEKIDKLIIVTGKGLHSKNEKDPFVSIDIEGVGKLIEIAAERGRKRRPDIKLGICGEHGGDPESVAFCEKIGLDYVSCSPYRVPIARLAAAQAVLRTRTLVED